MVMLEHSTRHHPIISTTAGCLLAMSIVYMALVALAAHHIAAPSRAMQHATVGLGPLQITAITKTPVPGGHQVALQLLPGMWLYVAAWLVVGCAGTVARLRLAQRRNRLPPG